MAEVKDNGAVMSQIDLEGSNANLSAEKKGTVDDQRDMFRLGKAQELRVCAPEQILYRNELNVRLTRAPQRNFRFVSIFGFSMILMASWETMLGSA